MRKFSRALGAALAVLFATSVQAQDQGPVKLGLMEDLSGPQSDLTGKIAVEMARIAVEEVGGKVLGKPVEIVVADFLHKPDVALSIARQWWDVDKVDAIVDVPNSGISLAINHLAGERKKMVLFSSPSTDRMTEEDCNGYAVSWTQSVPAIVNAVVTAQMKKGMNTWFIIGSDYAFGKLYEEVTTKFVTANGGKVVGAVRAPLGSTEFSSYILQAKASKADVVMVTLGGTDLINAMKQMREFKVVAGGQHLAMGVVWDSDVRSVGLETLQGIQSATPFYWNMDDKTRELTARLQKTMPDKVPNGLQAGVYSVVRTYLKAVEAAGTKDPQAVFAQMQKMKIDDAFARGATLRPNGRLAHDMLLVEIKSPAHSKGPWDIFNVISTIPAEDAFGKLSDSKCPLIKK